MLWRKIMAEFDHRCKLKGTSTPPFATKRGAIYYNNRKIPG